MIGRIIDFSYRNPWLIFLFAAVASVLGWNAMRSTRLQQRMRLCN